jgi:ATP diphosphatase
MTRRPGTTAPDRRAGRAFARLVRLMSTLRSPAGCAWDRAQSHQSLRPFLLEETYEALDAIDRGDLDALRGELGDVLFQCVFHAQIAAESGRFDAADAVDAIAAKLIRRHPHVFAPDGRPLPRAAARRRRVRTPRAVVEQWEQIKAREQTSAGAETRLLAGVPRALPALLRAYEIGSRVAAVGFDWPQAGAVVDKIEEEVHELREAVTENPARAAEELGDLLFSIANLARKLGVEPESALREANDKFAERFAGVEATLKAAGRSVHEASLDEMEAAWQRVKTRAARQPSRSGRRANGPARRGRRSRG